MTISYEVRKAVVLLKHSSFLIKFSKKVLYKELSYSMIFEVYDCIRLSNVHRRKRIPYGKKRERYGTK